MKLANIRIYTEEEFQDKYSFVFLYGLLTFKSIGDLALCSVLGFNIFKRVGDKSLLFGVNW
ncbi:hypothetical protein OAA60_03465 [Porticoccaceae bacterium]|nr:hypothetical protein [Porticoccaceae bacterium]